MGEKVILREQVKELFNKKYGQLETFTCDHVSCSVYLCLSLCTYEFPMLHLQEKPSA